MVRIVHFSDGRVVRFADRKKRKSKNPVPPHLVPYLFKPGHAPVRPKRRRTRRS